MSIERDIEWIGDPIAYRRPAGSGLITGRYHYLFDTTGQLKSAQPITRPVLAAILSVLYPDHAMAMAAYVRVVKEPVPAVEETPNEQ